MADEASHPATTPLNNAHRSQMPAALGDSSTTPSQHIAGGDDVSAAPLLQRQTRKDYTAAAASLQAIYGSSGGVPTPVVAHCGSKAKPAIPKVKGEQKQRYVDSQTSDYS